MFFFNDTATTEIYTLSLHDALPISVDGLLERRQRLDRLEDGVERRGGHRLTLSADPAAAQPLQSLTAQQCAADLPARRLGQLDRKSTRLNSSHANISYAVFCLKKKK